MLSSFNNKKQKAVLITKGNPVFGEVGNVRVDEKTGKVLLTLVTLDGETEPFDVKKKLESQEFKLISDEVFSMISNAGNKNNVSKPENKQFEEKKSNNSYESDLKEVRKGAIVETMILSGRYQGIWVKAKVTQIDQETIDLRVLLPKKWKVAAIALGVPKKYIRQVLLDETGNYIVPIEFIVDDSILYLGCSKDMKIKHLKITVAREKRLNKGQLFFMNKGMVLEDTDPIPNDVIFCIIHSKGIKTSKDQDVIKILKKKKSEVLEKKEILALGVL